MDYQTSKIILWAMLCFPILVIGIYMIYKLMDDIIIINRVKKQRYMEQRQKYLDQENARRRRERFERNYSNYLNVKYSENENDSYE